ncbi:50S ribosomal protein L9 [Candidatus Margulisiibacteriota bacterium]
MKVILISDVDKLGNKDTVVDVSVGYARNYLMPKKLAIPANENSVKVLEAKRKRAEAKLEGKKENYRQIADKLDNLSVEIKMDVGEAGKLFGSVTTQDIVSAVKELIGIDLDKKQIILEDHIKVAGKADVEVRFASDIKATLSVLVSPNK